jgi:hypothetical protein
MIDPDIILLIGYIPFEIDVRSFVDLDHFTYEMTET